jgi:NAD(P)-dependent dehydrogenase (short-subunit alcohol dehydrogenase family)
MAKQPRILVGQVAAITGAARGIGKATAQAFAREGMKVAIGDLDAELAEQAAVEVGPNAAGFALDVTRRDSFEAFVEAAEERFGPIDVLVNNAGVMACPLARTADGFEMQFGTNHLGHFLWTARLFPLLMASVPARVVNLSSAGHLIGGVDLDDPNFEHRDYDKWVAYGQAKTANILFTRELERRFGDHGLHAYAVHPGAVATELARHLDRSDFEAMVERMKNRPKEGPSTELKQVDTGASTQVWAATGEDIPGGSYLADTAVSEFVAPHATDDTAALGLWEISEQLVGEPFPNWD